MALSNAERVGKALDLLKAGLQPFVEREMKAQHAQLWFEEAKAAVAVKESQETLFGTEAEPRWDVAALLAIMWNQWQLTFRKVLGQAERTLISELRDVRNRWAHQKPFTSDDAYRALDSAARLLTAISAPQADEIEKMKGELLRVRFDEQLRSDKRKTAGTAVESQVTGGLKPWREVVTPHKDVASGRYQQAEFAADLWQVHLGEGSDEYRKPTEFFRRTFLTESLGQLLTNAIRRLTGDGGDPVVQLQTNFGGGKTHSMLALYHLFSGIPPAELVGIDAVLKDADVTALPKVKRVVLVGNKISPGNPVKKPDGTEVRTLWGELAWQLGGKKAYGRIRLDDERATSPGDRLRELMDEYGPCLILIDEWVAYARQLHDASDLPAGSFETHFSFAQALTESAKLAKRCLLVISLPASDSAGSPHALADDVEVGGERGRAALDRLRNAVGRVEASWRPASAEEGFEIVRRRLFEPLIEQPQFVARDGVAKAFADLYRAQHQEFPPECRDADYEKRLKAAYPIHPEVFDRLYTDWSTLVKFQRTRGVLRMMAAVIHCLWVRNDRNPLIQPGNIPIDDPRVQFELKRYLSDNWDGVIDRDIDGANALPLRMDGEVPALGKFAACRRVARTVFLGSAPTATAANRGIEDRRIKLGCVMPSESPAVFGDALRRLSSAATYLYQDGPRYWFSTQPTVTKLAEDRAEQYRGNHDAVVRELDRRLRDAVKRAGDFSRVHPLPQSSQDVPDEQDARLVVLGTDHPYSKETGNAAQKAAQGILETRGSAPRLYRNTLVFLAVDKARLQDLDDAVRRYLAWESILAEKETLDLSPHQVKQAEAQEKQADQKVAAQIPEAYQWLLVPVQQKPDAPVHWQAFRLTGSDELAVRASKKLRGEELLITSFGPTRLRMELDRIPLWRGDAREHVAIRQLAEDFAQYLYLPRLKDNEVLLEAIRQGVGLISWEKESFAFADDHDDKAGRYLGLRHTARLPIPDADAPGLLVRPVAARRQIEADREEAGGDQPGQGPGAKPGADGNGADRGGGQQETPPRRLPTRYHGSITLDAARVGRDAGQIAEEIIAHLAGLVGAQVTVTLEIEATIPDGTPDNVVRIVTENGRSLKFSTHGFETD